MLNKRKKTIVCTAINDENGFTLVSMLFTIVVISVTIPFLITLIKSVSYSTSYEISSIQHFFYFLRDDLIKATSYSVRNNKLYLETFSGEVAIIEKFGSVVRRQVNGKGHEVYLRDVKDLLFTSHPNGIQATITSLQGEAYEKTIIFY